MDLFVIFYLWAGLLLSWGGFCLYRIFVIHNAMKLANRHERVSDKFLCCGVLLFQLILGYAVFFNPQAPHNMMEIFVGLSFWYTILLAYTQQVTSKFINKHS